MSLNVCRSDSVPTLSAIPAPNAIFSRVCWPPRDYCSRAVQSHLGSSSRQPESSREVSDLTRAVVVQGNLNHYALTTTRLSHRDIPLTTCPQVFLLPGVVVAERSEAFRSVPEMLVWILACSVATICVAVSKALYRKCFSPPRGTWQGAPGESWSWSTLPISWSVNLIVQP